MKNIAFLLAFAWMAAAQAADTNAPAQPQPVALTVQEINVIAFALRHTASQCGASNEMLCDVGKFEKQIDAKLTAALPPQSPSKK